MSDQPTFAICVSEDGCDDLTSGRVYRILPDESAAPDDFVRVVDDSGEDYLYPAARFVVVEVPPGEVGRVLAITSAGVA